MPVETLVAIIVPVVVVCIAAIVLIYVFAPPLGASRTKTTNVFSDPASTLTTKAIKNESN